MPEPRIRARVRAASRLIARVARSLAIPDRVPARPPGPVVLFSCHDADRGMLDTQGRFSQLLEGIRRNVVQLGYQAVNLSHPLASLRSDEVREGSILINRRALLSRVEVILRQAFGAPSQVRHEVEARLYERLLQQLRPATVFAIQPPPGLCLAARRLGVNVIEPMHGNNISLHDQVFMNHMALPDQLLPAVLLAFDDVTQATLRKACKGRDIAPLRTRHPWLQLCRRESVQRQAPAPANSRAVLLSLQWGYDGERDTLSGIVPNGVLHPAIEQAIAQTAGSGLQWRLRMHPVQVTTPGYSHHRRYLEQLVRHHPHVELEQATAMPLPLLLDEAFAHVTMSSASAGDAAEAGVPSLLLCPTLKPGGANHGLFRELEAQGQVSFGGLDAAVILDWIRQCPARVPPAVDAAKLAREQESDLTFYRQLLEQAPSAAARVSMSAEPPARSLS